jgi:HEAT repeat protein
MGFMGLFGAPNVDKLMASGNIKGLIKALGYKKKEFHKGIERTVFVSTDRAIDALVKIGTPAVEQLIFALQNKIQDTHVRMAAVEALGKIGGDRAINALIAAIYYRDTTNDRNISESAIEVLGQIGDARGIEPIIGVLRYENAGQSARRKAAEALGKIGGEQAVDVLIDFLLMGGIIEDKAVEEDSEAIINLELLLKNPYLELKKKDQGVAHGIGLLLQEMQGDLSVEDDAYPRYFDIHVRMSAAEALGKSGNSCAVRPLIAALNHAKKFEKFSSKFDLRKTICAALGQIGSGAAIDALIEAQDEDDIRNDVIKAIGSTRSERAVEYLIGVLENAKTGSYTRIVAVEGLGRIGSDRAIAALMGALLDSDVSCSVVKALSKTGDSRFVEIFISALKHPDWETREAAAEALEQINDARAVEPLIVLIKESKESWKFWVTRPRPVGIIPVSHYLAPDKDWEYRTFNTAVSALIKIKNIKDVDAFTALIKDWDDQLNSIFSIWFLNKGK